MSGWLGVHVRRSDKLVQCPQNDLALEDLLAQIRGYCVALGCSCVFLCSCDRQLKVTLSAKLESGGLRCASLDDAALSSCATLPPHMDDAVDARRNAEDCLVEVLVLSRCAALLSTWSHVSVAAVYFAPDGFRHFMFGEPPPAPAVRPPLLPPPPKEPSRGADKHGSSTGLASAMQHNEDKDLESAAPCSASGSAYAGPRSTLCNARLAHPRPHAQARRIATRQTSRWRAERIPPTHGRAMVDS
jgi:hypothetical protein